jgi:hypothetical protein
MKLFRRLEALALFPPTGLRRPAAGGVCAPGARVDTDHSGNLLWEASAFVRSALSSWLSFFSIE